MYLCRDGKTNVHWRQSTSCSSNDYNCSVQLQSPASVVVKSNTVNGFYELVNPISEHGHTFKYIKDGCLSSNPNPPDCRSACPNN